MVAADPLGAIAALPEVAESATAARAAIDPLLLDRRLRTQGSALAAEAALLNAHASSTIEGAEVPLDELRARASHSPVLRVASGALDVQLGLRGMRGLPARQVWAAIAVISGAEYLDKEQRGRPRRAGERLFDPLHLGFDGVADDLDVRLSALAELVAAPTKAPALVVSALAHAELLVLQPFGAGNGVVARAYAHHVLAERGLDPDFFAMTDVGLLSLGRAAYVRAVRGYRDGGADGVATWCVHVASAFERGAHLARQTLDRLSA